MPRTRDFAFTKIIEVSKPEAPKHKVYIKANGQILFPQKFVKEHNLENSLIEFQVDNTKKVIGFRRLIGDTPQELEALRQKLPMSRDLKINSTGYALVGFSRIAQNIPWMRFPEKSYGAPIGQYKEYFYFDPIDHNEKKVWKDPVSGEVKPSLLEAEPA